jgi:hypothetical protein
VLGEDQISSNVEIVTRNYAMRLIEPDDCLYQLVTVEPDRAIEHSIAVAFQHIGTDAYRYKMSISVGLGDRILGEPATSRGCLAPEIANLE